MSDESLFGEVGPLLIAAVGVVLPSPGLGEQFLPGQSDQGGVYVVAGYQQPDVGVLSVVLDCMFCDRYRIRLDAVAPLEVVGSSVVAAYPCRGLDAEGVGGDLVTRSESSDHHGGDVERPLCGHGHQQLARLRRRGDVEHHPVEAADSQLASLEDAEAPDQEVDVAFPCGIVGHVPSVLSGVREQHQEVFILCQVVQAVHLHDIVSRFFRRFVAEYHHHLALLGVRASGYGDVSVHGALRSLSGVRVVLRFPSS